MPAGRLRRGIDAAENPALRSAGSALENQPGCPVDWMQRTRRMFRCSEHTRPRRLASAISSLLYLGPHAFKSKLARHVFHS